MAKRPPQRPEFEDRQFTAAEIDQGIARLTKRVEELHSLLADQIHWRDGRIDALETSIENTIREVFGARSHLAHENRGFRIYRLGLLIGGTPDSEYQRGFEKAVPRAVAKVEGLIAILTEKRQYLPRPTSPKAAPSEVPAKHRPSRKVFLVHGHDEGAKEMVARYLMQLQLDPIILHEKANLGKTIIEKLEHYADVAFAVVLLTRDDLGAPISETDPDKFQPRARQNVVLEFGLFIGLLGREHVCALYKKGVELPSDVHGLLYVSLDDNGWKNLLAREIDAAGITIDLNLTK